MQLFWERKIKGKMKQTILEGVSLKTILAIGGISVIGVAVLVLGIGKYIQRSNQPTDITNVEPSEIVETTMETSITDVSITEPTNSEVEITDNMTETSVEETTEPPETTEEPVVDDTPTTTYVYISQSGSRYHSNPNCSNMKNPSEVTLEYAEEHGYKPCSKCY